MGEHLGGKLQESFLGKHQIRPGREASQLRTSKGVEGTHFGSGQVGDFTYFEELPGGLGKKTRS